MGQSFEDIAQERAAAEMAAAEMGKPKLVLAASARIIKSMSRAVLQDKSSHHELIKPPTLHKEYNTTDSPDL